MRIRRRAGRAAGLVASGIASMMATAGAVEGDRTAPVRVNGTDANVMMFQRDGRVLRLFGEAFSHGATPEASAEAFLQANANLVGATRVDLGAARVNRLDVDRANGTFRFTLLTYEQSRAGVPVFRGQVKLLVRNEPGFPLVWANPAVRDVNAFRPNVQVVDVNARMGGAVARQTAPNLAIVTAPRLVIWAGVDDDLVEPRLAWEFVGESPTPGAPDYAKVLFLTDADTGVVLYSESQILHADVEGSVSAQVTQGLAADICGPVAPEPLPYTRVNIGGTTAHADADGNFVIPWDGDDPVTVESPVRGRYFRVFNESGDDTVLAMNVTPPGPAEFMHNDANDNEFQRAEVNAYLHANVARDFILTYSPEYPTIWEQEEFRVNVNRDLNCNATYSGNAINFYTSGGACPNTAWSSIVYHEYGHHMVATGGSGQGQYGEGMSDTLSVIIQDDPGTGYAFYGNCKVPLRTADNEHQYPCDGAPHSCGNLISGCVWSTRNELISKYPDDYLEILRPLVVNSVPMHIGARIDPSITLDYLTLDDDDDNLYNGTPHYAEIAAGFSAHNMSPPLQFVSFVFPDGLPDIVDPDGTTTARVNIIEKNVEPLAGSGILHWDDGNGVVDIPMPEGKPNEYEFAFPAADCLTEITYYFSVEIVNGFRQFWPHGAPHQRREVISANGVDLSFTDDFEEDLVWAVQNDFDLEDGAWERGVPAGGGDNGDPEQDADHSGQCYVTGNAPGQDVDGGYTTLVSPVMDATNPDAVMVYEQWWVTSDNSSHALIEVSDDYGFNWTLVEVLHFDDGIEEWRQVEYVIADIPRIENNEKFRARFKVTDSGEDSLVEMGIDAFRIMNGYECDDACPADLDGSGDVSFNDLLLVLAAWGPYDPCPPFIPADLDEDCEVDFIDLVELLSVWGPCP